MNDNGIALTPLHRGLHERLLAMVEDMLVSSVALDFETALWACQRLALAIDEHRAAEELALAALCDEPPLPRGAAVSLVVAEHDKLNALIGHAAETLGALGALDPGDDLRRRALVRHLEPLTRVKGLLEHHTQRELELVYPHLERHLPVAAKAALVTSIAALLTSFGSERPDA